MGGIEPTIASEDLGALLQVLEPGAHIAVQLGVLELGTALRLSRQAAKARGDRFFVIGDRDRVEGSVIADSLGKALSMAELATAGRDALLVVDAQTSVQMGGAASHAAAEESIAGRGLRLTIICFYTEETLAAVSTETVHHVHEVFAVPGQV